jgi:hypothetical protein
MLTQLAIIFTKNNADLIAASLSDYTAQELLDEYDYMLKEFNNLVLVRSDFGDGASVLSHVVTTSMFYANAEPLTMLTDYHFTEVVQL